MSITIDKPDSCMNAHIHSILEAVIPKGVMTWALLTVALLILAVDNAFYHAFTTTSNVAGFETYTRFVFSKDVLFVFLW